MPEVEGEWSYQDYGLFGSVRVWGCPRCGALVALRAQHDHWHREMPEALRRWIEEGPVDA